MDGRAVPGAVPGAVLPNLTWAMLLIMGSFSEGESKEHPGLFEDGMNLRKLFEATGLAGF